MPMLNFFASIPIHVLAALIAVPLVLTAFVALFAYQRSEGRSRTASGLYALFWTVVPALGVVLLLAVLGFIEGLFVLLVLLPFLPGAAGVWWLGSKVGSGLMRALGSERDGRIWTYAGVALVIAALGVLMAWAGHTSLPYAAAGLEVLFTVVFAVGIVLLWGLLGLTVHIARFDRLPVPGWERWLTKQPDEREGRAAEAYGQEHAASQGRSV